MTIDHRTELAGRLRLSVMRLARRLRQQAPEGITPSQLSVLAVLESHGPMTLGELAGAERVSPPTMTRVASALEESGLVAREADESDRRRSVMRLTGEGRALIRNSRRRKTAYLAARFQNLSAAELETIERASALMDRLVAEENV
jgi:DNA-binding MarR family transcriptional regulator